jgi:hypothetical protein
VNVARIQIWVRKKSKERKKRRRMTSSLKGGQTEKEESPDVLRIWRGHFVFFASATEKKEREKSVYTRKGGEKRECVRTDSGSDFGLERRLNEFEQSQIH